MSSNVISDKVVHLAASIYLSICLAIIGISVFGPVELRDTMYAAPLSNMQGNMHIVTSSTVTPTLESYTYLPAVMQSFCTPVSIPVDAKLFGVVFFDFNGDGIRQSDEPGIADVGISVDGESTLSGCEGIYFLRQVQDSYHRLTVSAADFEFLSMPSGDFQTISNSIPVTVSGHTQLDIGLIEHILTIPFASTSDFYIYSWKDLDTVENRVRRYDGDTTECGWIEWPTQPILGTCDGHNGIDFVAGEDTPILAAAPGIVFKVATPEDPVHECLNVFILHQVGAEYFLSQYGHNSANLVVEGQLVKRGDPIALVGNSCTELFHLHFAWFPVPPEAATVTDPVHKNQIINEAVAVDPYRDLFSLLSMSFWTKDNDPQLP